ncbi:DUF2764 family protein [Bacteroides sp. 224]|uniref:DUF2764 family protein n=1 Tax=Bacteroides sp. 224 TaxID=2302936 RepID=UPI0013D5311C|nr:DUF2764 family protein [Bacteroides sp. 224]NDV66851.1 DUF2764 domain-containing protein [Bacteroides sp. 224]
MSNYYYLIASLPELNLEDNKLSYTVADFKEELYSHLSGKDKKLINLFYLKFDNENVLKLLRNKEAEIDTKGNYSLDTLLEYMHTIKEGGKVSSKDFPAYLSKFIADYYNSVSMEDESILLEDTLAALYYKYGVDCKNTFISSWFEFNLTLNNIFVALTARKYKIDASQSIIGDTEVTEALRTSGARDFGLTGEVEYFEQLVKINEIDELLERERKIDTLKWNWVEDAIFFNYFSIERLFAFLLKIEMIERWLSLDRERGSELFREIIESLKDDVQIPAEFK